MEARRQTQARPARDQLDRHIEAARWRIDHPLDVNADRLSTGSPFQRPGAAREMTERMEDRPSLIVRRFSAGASACRVAVHVDTINQMPRTAPLAVLHTVNAGVSCLTFLR